MEEEKKSSSVVLIIVIIAIIAVIGVCAFVGYKVLNGNKEETPDDGIVSPETSNELAKKYKDTDKDDEDKYSEIHEASRDTDEDEFPESDNYGDEEDFENSLHGVEVQNFNAPLLNYEGHKFGAMVDVLLDEVLEINEKGERTISVVLDNEEFNSSNEISSLKTRIQERQYYEVSFDYDGEYINRVIIK